MIFIPLEKTKLYCISIKKPFCIRMAFFMHNLRNIATEFVHLLKKIRMKRIKPILFCLMLLLTCIFTGQGQPKDVETGTFLDTLKLPGNNLRLAITLSKGSDGNFMAT